MTDYIVPFGRVGVHLKALAPDQVDTVTFQLGQPGTPGWASVPRQVEIMTDGADDVFVTVDGSVPTVAGDNTYRLPAAGGYLALSTQQSGGEPAAVVVKLISEGAPTYSVTRA